ncbi:hypothetical protein ACFOEY_12490 [Paracandidimonas soli]|uniref:hypothetical protein n=1 Tax=Paracandidimonas soli TaxID=1917182 RepID=UPI00360EB027
MRRQAADECCVAAMRMRQDSSRFVTTGLEMRSPGPSSTAPYRLSCYQIAVETRWTYVKDT